jgi:spermidine/putrescine ABC transporter ATP-binding subunit
MSTSSVGRDAFVDLVNLSKMFDDTPVVSSVSLSIQQGEIMTLLGPSGCGKTTTLRMLAGLETPTGGQVVVDGEDVTSLPPHRRNVGFVFQGYALFPHLTVSQNVAFGLRERRIPKAEAAERVTRTLELVRLAHLGHRKPKQLSGGQQQRVALARALVIEPSILMLDEPLAALDRKMREEMQSELRQLLKRLNTTAVLVTHDQEEALALSDRIAVMNQGRIDQVATPREIYDRPATAFCASFMGLSNLFAGHLANGHLVLPSGTAFACDGGIGTAVREASVIVRPEEVDIATTETSGSHRARVDSVTYLGPTTHYRVSILSGESFLVAGSGTGRPDVAEGHEVWLRVPRGSWRVLEGADEAADRSLASGPLGQDEMAGVGV